MMFVRSDKLNRVACYYRNLIEDQGLWIEHSADFEELERVSLLNGDKVTPHFSTDQNCFWRGYAFWVGVYKDGKCIATVACKKTPLGAETLAEYIQRYWRMVYQGGSSVPIEFRQNQKRFLQKLTGNLVYAGEYRVVPDYQNNSIGKWLVGYLKPATFLHWPDTEYFYIFMEIANAKDGLMAQCEFTTQIPNAINWHSHPSQAQPDYWMGGISSDDLWDWVDDHVQNSGGLMQSK